MNSGLNLWDRLQPDAGQQSEMLTASGSFVLACRFRGWLLVCRAAAGNAGSPRQFCACLSLQGMFAGLPSSSRIMSSTTSCSASSAPRSPDRIFQVNSGLNLWDRLQPDAGQQPEMLAASGSFVLACRFRGCLLVCRAAAGNAGSPRQFCACLSLQGMFAGLPSSSRITSSTTSCSASPARSPDRIFQVNSGLNLWDRLQPDAEQQSEMLAASGNFVLACRFRGCLLVCRAAAGLTRQKSPVLQVPRAVRTGFFR